MNFENQRKRMIETQLIPRGIHDPAVLKAMGKIPREAFVPAHVKEAAYNDCPLPISEEQTISQPFIVALMSTSLELQENDRVLEVGTGSGYQAAILAEIASEVYTVERVPSLAQSAEKVLSHLGYKNIHFKIFNGTLGWPEKAPYDAIIVTAGSPEVPQPLIDQLADEGRLVIPVGDSMGQELFKITKINEKTRVENLGAVRFVNLIGQYGWKEKGRVRADGG
jgi:protein-L-isoaspartate(D-aspartate) O-methyltransferase